MSAVALVAVPPDPNPDEAQTRRPQPVTDLGIAALRLALLGITIRAGQTSRGAAADWDPAHREVTLRPDTTVAATLWLLNDLYLLHTDPAHMSPSVPTPHLRAVQS